MIDLDVETKTLSELFDERAFHDSTDPECRPIDQIEGDIKAKVELLTMRGEGIIRLMADLEAQEAIADAHKKVWEDEVKKFRARRDAYANQIEWLKNGVLLPIVKSIGQVDKKTKRRFLLVDAGRKLRQMINPWSAELKPGFEVGELPSQVKVTTVSVDMKLVLELWKTTIDDKGDMIPEMEERHNRLKKFFNFSRKERCQLY